MNRVEHTDENGRMYLVMVGDDGNISSGTIIGPPDVVDLLELPEETAIRLHNELFRRKLFSYKDVSKHPLEIQGALQKVLRLDAATITTAYHQFEKETFSIEEV